MNPNDALTLMQERLDLGGKLLREIVQLRAQTGLNALSGPDQLFTEGS